MKGEFDFYGIFFHQLFIYAVIAFALTWCVRQLFAKLGVYRLVWHPALFDVALYVIILFMIDRVAATFLS